MIKSAIYLEAKHINTVVYNLLCGLKYLHSANIIHRDLKPANILINEDCSVQLADFGLSRSLQGIDSQSLKITKRLQQQLEDEQKADKKQDEVVKGDKNILGGQFAPIQSGDVSPGGMKVAEEQKEEAKTADDTKR